MLYIYLDTSHLQKWQQSTLELTELAILENMRNSGNCLFVLSLSHIFDITERDDGDKAIELAIFLDKLPKIWLRDPVDLKCEEIKYAIHAFQDPETPHINPFLNEYIDTWARETESLEMLMEYRGKSIEKIVTDIVNIDPKQLPNKLSRDNIRHWTCTNSAIIDKWPDSDKKEKESKKNFKRVMKDDIFKFKLDNEIIKYYKLNDTTPPDTNTIIEPINEFVDWCLKNPQLIPSIWFSYYTQHYIHRNKEMAWKRSHLYDLSHLTALPYVDYITVDGEIFEYAKQTITFAKRYISNNWNTKLFKSVKDIPLSFSPL